MTGILKLLGVFLIFNLSCNHSMATGFESMQQLGKGEAYYLKFIKVYDATLYSGDLFKSMDILDPTVSKCLKLDYAVGVKAEDFISTAMIVLKRQFTEHQLEKVSNELETLHTGYQDVEKGDHYALCYFTETGRMTLSLNGREVVSVTSVDFATMYFSIWLGKTNPLDETLRVNLLAKISRADGYKEREQK